MYIMEQTTPLADELLTKLTTLETDPNAKDWIDAIQETKNLLDNKKRPIIFIGKAGVGKSSIIAAIAKLLMSDSVSDKNALKKNSVLAIGAGKTTVCEVEVSYKEDQSGIQLEIEPTDENKMKEEICIYAEDQWQRHFGNKKQLEDSSSPIAIEIQRVIQHMTNYIPRFENGRITNPLDVHLDAQSPKFSSLEILKTHLIERANLSNRKKTQWPWKEVTNESLKQLQKVFAAVNQGSDPDATLPEKIIITLPSKHLGNTDGFEYSFVDTRGLDNDNITSRDDIQKHLRDPHALIILCSDFKDAPDGYIQALLRSLPTDAELRLAIPRLMLILVDQGSADQVNGADGNREYGQVLKIQEGIAVLRGNKLPLHDEGDKLIPFDVLQDDVNTLNQKIYSIINALNNSSRHKLDKSLIAAQKFIDQINHIERKKLLEKLDERLLNTLSQHTPDYSPPLLSPIQGALNAIENTRWASVVYASCRRNGEYNNLNLYAAIRTEASSAATAWLEDTISAALNVLRSAENEPEMQLISDHIALKYQQYEKSFRQAVNYYVESVSSEIAPKLRLADSTWQNCQKEWRQGSGFKNRVLNILKEWAFNQSDLIRHKDNSIQKQIPLLENALRLVLPAKAKLHIRNLRKLSKVDLPLETPIVVLIGANGSGKTTLLKTLKLLALIYKSDLNTAFSLVLDGTSNLKTRKSPENEAIEFGLEIGQIHWGFTIIGKEGTRFEIHEYLLENNKEIFTSNNLDGLRYGGEVIDERPNKIGIRILEEKSIHEKSLRTVVNYLSGISVYSEAPDLVRLRKEGSTSTEDKELRERGENTLAVLRRWSQEKNNQHRYQFVIGGLEAAFPNSFAALDFETAGNTLVARIYPPNAEPLYRNYLADEANGFVQMLVLLCYVANAEENGLVAIDEPENGLHPYAIRRFLDSSENWAKRYNLTIILTTHSPVILDYMNGSPEQIFVAGLQDCEQRTPVRLDLAFDREWLAEFELGDLYEHNNLGSNFNLGETITHVCDDNEHGEA